MSTGVLSPILTYSISIKAGKVQGAELGKQTAAASQGCDGFGSRGPLVQYCPAPRGVVLTRDPCYC